jgi:uncharacterized damage-inducible protein DinB
MFARLFAHLYWADQLVLESLRTARNPPPKAIELYSHVLGAEHVWMSRINGEQPKLEVWPELTLEECDRIAAGNHEGFRQLVGTITPSALLRGIAYRNSAGASFVSTLEDILTHVALHGSYHRGQIAASLRAGGETPVPTDFIVFARGSPTATRSRS